LKQQLANYRVPDVMEYVEEKANLYELQKKVKCWERKVDIAGVRCSLHFSAALLQLTNYYYVHCGYHFATVVLYEFRSGSTQSEPTLL